MTIEEELREVLRKITEASTALVTLKQKDLRREKLGNYSRVLEHLSNARTVLRLLAVGGPNESGAGSNPPV